MVTSNPAQSAVLLLAHGSPESADEIPEFLLRVTGGRQLPRAIVEEVKRRYRLIGVSPLTCRTMEQRDLLARELEIPVYVGMRDWKPFTADTLRAIAADGVRHVVVICLAPQNSRTSVGLYRSGLVLEGAPFTVDFVESWHDQPFLIQAFAEKLRAGLQSVRAEGEANLPVLFTAHSVPQPTITEGDPYEAQAKETAALVAREAKLRPEDWTFAFQSQGMSGGPWLGPTVEDTIVDLKAKSHRGVFIQPIGFLCDHVEILYDIDIGFKQFAEKQQMKLWRAQSLNDSPLLVKALAEIARSRLRQAA
jgi:ferrochelatase